MDGADDVDVELFIQEIKKHRSLWDFQSEEYRDRKKKQSAWEDVCKNTVLGFQTKSENERNSIMKKLILKWKNIKDNYKRNLRIRKRSGRPQGVGRKYIHEKYLSFLPTSMDLAVPQSSEDPSLDSPLSQSVKDEESSSEPVASSDPATPRPTYGASRTAGGQTQDSESSFIQFINIPEVFEPSNSNRLFFDSVIPMIKNFTEDQTLQFRSEVIELIRRIKRQNMVPPETHTPVPPRPKN